MISSNNDERPSSKSGFLVVVVVFDVVVVVVVDVVDNVALSRVGHPGCIKVVHAKQFVMILCYDRC